LRAERQMHYLDDFDIQSTQIDDKLYLSAQRADLSCDSRVNVFIKAALASTNGLLIDDTGIDTAEFNAKLNKLKSQKVLLVMSRAGHKLSWRLIGRD